jgi:hypothetical protein
MPRTFQQALTAVFEDPQLTKADRDHLERWASQGHSYEDIWRRLAVAAELHGLLPPNSMYETIVREALFMRATAESAQSGIDFNLRERQQYYERHLDLAKKSDELADYYRWAAGYSGIANFFSRFLQASRRSGRLSPKGGGDSATTRWAPPKIISSNQPTGPFEGAHRAAQSQCVYRSRRLLH